MLVWNRSEELIVLHLWGGDDDDKVQNDLLNPTTLFETFLSSWFGVWNGSMNQNRNSASGFFRVVSDPDVCTLKVRVL